VNGFLPAIDYETTARMPAIEKRRRDAVSRDAVAAEADEGDRPGVVRQEFADR
jgi:hypothetical protein